MSDTVYVGYDPEDTDQVVFPAQAHPTDAGYDVTVLRVHKQINKRTALYDTGLYLRPHDEDLYFDLVARSSLFTKGYMVANNVGVIDNGYRGKVMVALYKYDDEAPDLDLPARVAQLIPRRMVKVDMVDDAEHVRKKSKRGPETPRGEGGFGST